MPPFIHFGKTYQTGLLAIVDWVGGGNFSGTVYRKELCFYEKDNVVQLSILVVFNNEEVDKPAQTIIEGVYENKSRHLVCKFPMFVMIGKILGEKQEMIAFSITQKQGIKVPNECYALQA